MSGNGQTQAIQKDNGGKQAPKTIAQMILARKDSFAAVLPKHMTADRFVKVALAALTKTPKLRDCSPESLLMALAACSELGLEPNSPLGHAYLIPYGQEVQLVIGFKGLLAVARRSGEIESVSVRVVYERDQFSFTLGDDEKIEHIPFQPRVKFDEKGNAVGFDGPENGGNVIAAYMIAHLKGGAVQREVMSVAEILKIKNRSRSGKNGPWVSDFAEMARKTVFRRGWKWLPQSTEMAMVAEVDNDDTGERNGPMVIDVTPIAASSRGDALADAIEGAAPITQETAKVEGDTPATADTTPTREPGQD